MDIVQISGQPRTETGKSVAKKMRRNGTVPCVIYGGGDNIHFHADPFEFRSAIYTGRFKLCEVTIDGETYKCIVKQVQWHPITEDILHVDFLRLVDGHPFTYNIPLRFEGKAIGTTSGGKLMPKLRKVTVRSTPENIVFELVKDVTDLELGNSYRIRDLDVPEGLDVINAPGVPICSVDIPRALRAAAKEEAAAAEAAEALAAMGEGEGEGEETEEGAEGGEE